MFGFSLPKILLLLFVIVLVWNFFKFLEKISNKKKVKRNTYEEEQVLKEDEALIECEACGSFYSINLEKECPECKNKK